VSGSWGPGSASAAREGSHQVIIIIIKIIVIKIIIFIFIYCSSCSLYSSYCCFWPTAGSGYLY
jgi:hypothetical protein